MRLFHDRRARLAGLLIGAVLLLLAARQRGSHAAPGGLDDEPGWKLIGWSRRGLREMDADFSVFALHPPYSTIQAQLIDPRGDRLGHPVGLSMRYEAIADAEGSINASSIGKTGFWDHVQSLYGRDLAPDAGLAGHDMPGAPGMQQSLPFEAEAQVWQAEGIPITPFDDRGARNPYPRMRLTAYDAEGLRLASTELVLPVSDGMSCRVCHGTGAVERARPEAGWADDPDPERDYRLNILRLHDEKQAEHPDWPAALAARGYHPDGLFATVTEDERPILCAGCHATVDPESPGREGLPPLSLAVHGKHVRGRNPATGQRLTEVNDRSSCTICHSGAEDEASWLRGAMGRAVNAQGQLAIHCQDCHGSLEELGRPDRQPWLDLPDCGSCHTGTATDNAGQIRFGSVWEDGRPRQPVSPIFANVPTRTYAESRGHGGLQCAACHGPAHAVLPGREGKDGLSAIALQGHARTLGDCEACHSRTPSTLRTGPHGMHSPGQAWVGDHGEAARRHPEECAGCHGADGRGTVLSRALAARSLDAGDSGRLELWPGFQVGCYACHDGPQGGRPNPNRAPVVRDLVLAARPGQPVELELPAEDPDGDALSLRIVSRPARGRVALEGRRATYLPEPEAALPDQFTFAAWDGSVDSPLGRVTIQPAPGPAPGTRAWLPRLLNRPVTPALDAGSGGASAAEPEKAGGR